MRYINFILRYSFAFHFTVFGLNKFVVFYPVVAHNHCAQTVIDSFYATGYLMELVGACQIISGTLMLFNRTFLIGILIALPITLNILAYTVFTANWSWTTFAALPVVLISQTYFLYYFRKRLNQLIVFKTL